MANSYRSACCTFLFLGMLAAMAGCSIDGDEPLIPKPIGVPPVPSGYILAGEVSSRVVSVLGSPCDMDAEIGWRNQCSVLVATSPVVKLIGRCNYTTSPENIYISSQIQGDPFNVLQIAGFSFQDSLMECWEISPDSLSGRITQFNSFAPHTCNGQLYYAGPLETTIPTGWEEGARIDSTANWVSIGYFYESSETYQFNQGFAPDRQYFRKYDVWDGTKQYVGFRFPGPDGFQYGYARVAAGHATLTLYEVVIER